MWQQTYVLFGMGSLGSALIAAPPIAVMLVLLGVFRKPAWLAAWAGLDVTFVVTLGHHMPLPLALSTAANGAAFGVFPICWVIFWAITLFRITVDTGNFEIIKDSIEFLTPIPGYGPCSSHLRSELSFKALRVSVHP